MAATPPEDPEAALRAAEAAHLAARDTVPIGVAPAGDAESRRPTVRLPRQRGRGGRRHAPLALAAAVATAFAALLSAAPVVLALGLAKFAEDDGSAGAAIRLGLAGWLLGHGVELRTGAGPLGLVPLGLTVLAGWRVTRAGVHTTRGVRARSSGSPRRAFAVAGAVGVWYGLFGGCAALVVGDGGDPAVSAARATATLAAFGAGFGLIGALRTTGVSGSLWRRTPPLVRDAVHTAGVATLLLLAAAAAGVGVALAMGAGEASDVLGAYRTGVTGQAGITLICLAYAPNCAVWAAAYLIGPGFSVGTDTLVRVTDVSVGGLPAIPVFAALPAGPQGAVGAALVGLPVVAGMAGGWLLSRRRARAEAAVASTGRSRGHATRGPATRGPATRGGGTRAGTPARPALVGLLGAAALAGPVAGALLGAAALAASGSLGGGRLSQLGPVAWQVALIGAGVITAGAIMGAAAGRSAGRPR